MDMRHFGCWPVVIVMKCNTFQSKIERSREQKISFPTDYIAVHESANGTSLHFTFLPATVAFGAKRTCGYRRAGRPVYRLILLGSAVPSFAVVQHLRRMVSCQSMTGQMRSCLYLLASVGAGLFARSLARSPMHRASPACA